jgi:hypothetical protein
MDGSKHVTFDASRAFRLLHCWPSNPLSVKGAWVALETSSTTYVFLILSAMASSCWCSCPSTSTMAPCFSKTSGRSFLPRRCQGDLLYMSDPCEHAAAAPPPPTWARTAACSESSRGLGPGLSWWVAASHLKCTSAPLLRRTAMEHGGGQDGASQRVAEMLGAYEGRLKYYVCVREHLYGNCWLGRLTSSEGEQDGADGHASMGGGSEDGHVVLS